MESFRKKSKTFFRLSPAERAEAQCFGMTRGELTDRIDANYWRFSPLLHQRLSSSRYPLITAGLVVSKEPEYGSGARAVERLSVYQPRYIRITDFGEDGIEPDHDYAAPDPIDESCLLSKDDLLFARTGATVGKTYLHEDDSEAAIFAGYCIRFRFSPNLANTRFVYWYTKTNIYNLWVRATQRPAGQPNINKEEYKTLPIPLPKDIKEQERLAVTMDKAREEHRKKLAEATGLLAGLDKYLIEALGFDPPAKDNRKAFATTVRSAREQYHINADYFHPERILAIRQIKAAKDQISFAKLSDVVLFVRDQISSPGANYLSLAHVKSNSGELVESDEGAEGACSEYKIDDVLFARLRPYLNKVYRAEMNGCCSPEFHVLRIKNLDTLMPDYLAAILRSSITLAQTRHMMTGNTHPRITNDDVANLIFPIPMQMKLQEDISKEALRRREQARRLRIEAETNWQHAKLWFEAQLLGANNS